VRRKRALRRVARHLRYGARLQRGQRGAVLPLLRHIVSASSGIGHGLGERLRSGLKHIYSGMVETRRQSRAGAAETPAKFQYEFNGPYLGPLGVMLGLPVCCYALVALCNGHSCVSVGGLRDGSWSTSQMALPQPLATVDGLTAVLAWCAALVVLHLVLPGRRKQGSVLPDGTRLTYKLNGPCDPLPRLCLERWSMRAASTTT